MPDPGPTLYDVPMEEDTLARSEPPASGPRECAACCRELRVRVRPAVPVVREPLWVQLEGCRGRLCLSCAHRAGLGARIAGELLAGSGLVWIDGLKSA